MDTHGARLSVRSRALEVRLDGALQARYPMASLDAVVITGRAGITTEAMARCQSAGIRIAALHRGGGLRFTVGGPTSGNVLLRVGQIRAADDPGQALALAADFVAGKLKNQLRLLRRWSDDAPGSLRRHVDDQAALVRQRLDAVATAPTGDHLRGLEGDATRRYFKAMAAHLSSTTPETPFTRRSRRPPRDPVNALLGYVYGLVLAQAVGAAEAVGLDPQVGFLHGLRPGRPSLGLDLVEELRPAFADRFAVRVLSRRQVVVGDFHRTPGGAVYLTDDGRKKVLSLFDEFRATVVPHVLLGRTVPRSSLPVIQATLLARRLRGDLTAYPPFVAVA